jgi:DnaJ-class molecular chaperone
MRKISGHDAWRMFNNPARRNIPDNRRCETCEGDGCITIPKYHSWDGYAEEYAECPDCEGSGECEEREEEETEEPKEKQTDDDEEEEEDQ